MGRVFLSKSSRIYKFKNSFFILGGFKRVIPREVEFNKRI
jgi:hypothetical protein